MEQDIEETLASLNNISRAQADPFLYQKVMAKIEQRRNAEILPRRLVYRVAAVSMVMAILYLSTCLHIYRGQQTLARATLQEFAQEYFAGDTFQY